MYMRNAPHFGIANTAIVGRELDAPPDASTPRRRTWAGRTMLGLLPAGVIAAWILVPALAQADLVRIELGASAGQAMPRSFEEAVHRIERAGLTTYYTDGPYYDQWYTTVGGATYGNISINRAGSELFVTWVVCDTLDIANHLYAEWTQYPTQGSLYEQEGVYVLYTYSYNGDAAAAQAVMDVVLND